MAIATGVYKKIAYKKEDTWGVVPAASGAKYIRRVTGSFNLTKEFYESAEIRVDHQVADYRGGIRSAEGSLNGELSAGSYSDFMQSIVARDFTAVNLGAAVSMTVATSGSQWKLVRTTGSFLTQGLQPGMVIRAAGLTATADNGKNLLVLSVTALEVVVMPLNGSTLTVQATDSSVTLTAPGKQTFVPQSNHTDDSYTFEDWYSDVEQSAIYTGMKVGSMAVSLPSTGMATVDFSFQGKDMAQTGTTQYFTTPAAQSSTGVMAAVNGAMLVNGIPVALVTSADLTIERALENATAVGSNSVAEVFTGRIRATGNMSVYFTDAQFRSYFDQETPVSVVLTMTQDNQKDANFISIVLPKVKFGSFTLDDGELGLTASSDFQALLNDITTGGLPVTTVAIQDSAVA